MARGSNCVKAHSLLTLECILEYPMLLQQYFLEYFLPDCCDTCCDCEKADPKKDRVVFNPPPITSQEKVLDVEPVKPSKVWKPLWATEDGIKPVEVSPHDERKERILEYDARMEREQWQAEEAQELKRAKEIAEAIEVEEVIEAQELKEAQEASLREHELRLCETAKTIQDEEDKMTVWKQCCMKEQRLKEEREDQLKVDSFLKANGFANLDSKRKLMFKSFYPLHRAVSQNNAEMVQLLLAAGARPMLKNSSSLSPLQLALKLDRSGSHMQVIKLLKFGAEE